MAKPSSNAYPNLGNDPPEEKPPPRALSKRELRELRKKEKKVGRGPEKLEVRFDSHLFQQNVILTPPQMSKGQTRPQLEEEETEGHEFKKLEVYYDPHIFRHRGILTVAGGEAARRTRTRGEGG